jgi:hypothetical protein
MWTYMVLILTAAFTSFVRNNDWENMSSDGVRAAYRLYGFHNCNRDQEYAILEALKDKHRSRWD